MLLAWAVIGLLILLTGLYVAAEFAAVSARRSRLRRLAEDGDGLALRLLPVLEDPRALDRYIAASQVGITLSSLLLGAYGQATLAPRLVPLLARFEDLQPSTVESASAAIVLIFLTTLAVILGELVPKSLALQNPTRTALFTVLPMQWSMRRVLVVHRLAQWKRRADAACASRPVDGSPPRALTRGDRTADRRKPRWRIARAAGAGTLAPRTAPGLTDRAPTDGSTRAACRHRRGAFL